MLFASRYLLAVCVMPAQCTFHYNINIPSRYIQYMYLLGNNVNKLCARSWS